MRLYHLSDDPGIAVFRPRPSDYTPGPVVWAIDETRIANYLLPRDCPRVCFRAGPDSRRDEIDRLLGSGAAVIAIEVGWLARLEQGCLWRYEMPMTGFRLQDEGAGYWVSDDAVVPLGVEKLADLPAAIAAEGVTLRVMESLWVLHDAVRASSLVFSLIRMRNAAGR